MRSLLLDHGPVVGPSPSSPTARAPRRWAPLVPWIAYAVGVTASLLVARGTVGPWAMGDELLYRLGAEDLWRGAYPGPQYPPLYPLVISPALLAGERAYEAVLALNALVSSAVVFPLWALARRWLDQQRSRVLVVAIALALPFHVVFPRMVMSENLYLPLLVWFVHLLVEARLRGAGPGGRRWAAAAGAVLGLCLLTRHISLVLVPVLVVALVLPVAPRARDVLRNVRVGPALCGLAGLAVVYAPWLVLAEQRGFALSQAVGLHISTDAAIADPAAADLALWALRYAAYACLAAAPFLPLLLLALRRPSVLDRPRWELVGVTALVSLALAAAATRHSWLVVYNSPVPLRIMGRYVIFLGVPWLVVAAAVLERLPRARVGAAEVLASLLGAVALLGAGWALLYLPDPQGIVTVVNGTTVWALVESGLVWVLLAVLEAIAVVVLVRGRAPAALLRAWLPAVLVVTCLGTAVTHHHNTVVDDPHDRARHTRVVAGLLAAQTPVSSEAVVSYDLPDTFGDGHVASGIRFWGAEQGSFRVQRVGGDVAGLQGDADDLLVVPDVIPGRRPLRSYEVHGITYRVYRPTPAPAP